MSAANCQFPRVIGYCLAQASIQDKYFNYLDINNLFHNVVFATSTPIHLPERDVEKLSEISYIYWQQRSLRRAFVEGSIFYNKIRTNYVAV